MRQASQVGAGAEPALQELPQPVSAPVLMPVFLKLAGRRVLVVGGGAIASRTAEEWCEAEARVRVVAPWISPELQVLSTQVGDRLELVQKEFAPEHLEGVHFVIAATNDPAVQREVARLADARGLFVNAIDDLPNASAYAASLLRRPPFTVALSSAGAAPALTRLMREVLESVLPSDRWVAQARYLRGEWRRRGTPMTDRFPALLRQFTQAAWHGQSLGGGLW